MKSYKRTIISSKDSTITAEGSFDSIWEVFEWSGSFEHFQAKWRVEHSNDELVLIKDDHTLMIKSYKEEKSRAGDYFTYLPDEVALNSKCFNRFQLQGDAEEQALIEQ